MPGTFSNHFIIDFLALFFFSLGWIAGLFILFPEAEESIGRGCKFKIIFLQR
jgi:hypothetical protein